MRILIAKVKHFSILSLSLSSFMHYVLSYFIFISFSFISYLHCVFSFSFFFHSFFQCSFICFSFFFRCRLFYKFECVFVCMNEFYSTFFLSYLYLRVFFNIFISRKSCYEVFNLSSIRQFSFHFCCLSFYYIYTISSFSFLIIVSFLLKLSALIKNKD